MTAHNGRLEVHGIVVPTGGWEFDFTDGDGTHTGTVAAGTYSPTTLLTAFVAELNAQSANTYTGSCANGEGGTGAVTIVNADADVTDVTWTDPDLRDALGFSGDLPMGGTELGPRTFTGLHGMRGLWLPDCTLASPYGALDNGHREGGPVQTVSPLGATKTIVRPVRVRCGPFRWSHVTAARARMARETVARSFERLMADLFFAEVGYITPGCAVRLYWDAGASDYVEFHPIAPRTTATQLAIEPWTGLYGVSIEGWET